MVFSLACTIATLSLFSFGAVECVDTMFSGQIEDPDEGCLRPNHDVFCFMAGDPRASEQTVSLPAPSIPLPSCWP